jgi:2-methylaconitate cis-trans-isomerase PrpF
MRNRCAVRVSFAVAAGLALAAGVQEGQRVRVIAARTGVFYGRAMTSGDIYVVAGGGTRILGDGGPATRARFDPVNVAVSAAGSLLVTDNASNRIRAIAPCAGP